MIIDSYAYGSVIIVVFMDEDLEFSGNRMSVCSSANNFGEKLDAIREVG